MGEHGSGPGEAAPGPTHPPVRMRISATAGTAAATNQISQRSMALSRRVRLRGGPYKQRTLLSCLPRFATVHAQTAAVGARLLDWPDQPL
ncbi:hypothetical protein ABZ567_23365 [Streptomyces sp. NPDC016459]|uniref:hypothetical protein n=1 Tax=Streptomyces sp. NPDC016459 TaxID=3157190 RepID=UPI0033C10611